MHINSNLVETIYFITALVLDGPKMGINPLDPFEKFQSPLFKRLIQFYDRKVLVGPPENSRDYIMAALDAQKRGDWAEVSQLLKDISVWSYFPLAEQALQNLE